MEYTQLTEHEKRIGKTIVGATFKIHKEQGLGLLERVYEVCMAHELVKSGYPVKRQVNIPIVYDNIIFEEGQRLDPLVDDRVVVELKAIETVNPVWKAQIISQLKLTRLKLGYLINFNVPLIMQGISRFRV